METELKQISSKEKIEEKKLAELVEKGRACVFGRGEKAIGIGELLSTKTNANIGTSPDFCDVQEELKKLRASEQAGADTVMDLSTGGDTIENLKTIVKHARIPVGSVPVYSAICSATTKRKKISDLSEDNFMKAVEEHAKAGVDFTTVHCAITSEAVKLARKRVLKIVSRGGSFLAAWMTANEKENPLYKNFEAVIEIAKAHGIAISLGDALRPGCIADANDEAQLHELKVQGELVKKCIAAKVGVVCEGPGHVPLNEIAEHVKFQKKICSNAPYYLLGPIVTDIAPGYDHITSAIGAAVAAAAGADYICVVTPSEHLALPTAEDVREGVMTARIAAHAGDIAKYGQRFSERDKEMSVARAKLDWEKQFQQALDEKKAREIKEKRNTKTKACSMCGEYCAYKISENI
ncbi:phosphomethylpyrimidine synthase ThiC [Candidatus Micrarchaeota archaeon]|nr:phosphomethylpyrimidine synthase ThiC [Candidatus Micrarchaeota archaeon]